MRCTAMEKHDSARKPDLISEDGVAAALDGIRRKIAELDEARREVEKQLSVSREEERLLKRLLSLRTGETPQEASPIVNEPSIPHLGDAAFRGVPAVAAVLAELSAAGRPLHVSELMRLLSEKNVTIPGAGTQANLIAHMRRTPQIVRPSRGMYALASSGLEDTTARPRKRRRKRVRVVAGAKEI